MGKVGDRIRARLHEHDQESIAREKKRKAKVALRAQRIRRGVDTANMRKMPDGSKPPPNPHTQKLVAIRLPPALIEDVKAQAARFSMTWQPFMRILVLQGLHHLSEHDSLDVPVATDAESKVLRAQQRAAVVAQWKLDHPEFQGPTPAPKKSKAKKKVPSDVPPPEPVDTANGASTPAQLRAAEEEQIALAEEPTKVELQEALQQEPKGTSKAKLLRAMLEEHDGPLPTIPAPGMEGLVEALCASSVPPAPRDTITPPGPGYVMMQASESGEEIALMREHLDYDALEAASANVIAEHNKVMALDMNGVSTAPSLPVDVDKILEGQEPEEMTPELAAILYPEEQPTEPEPVDTLSKEATPEDIDALLGGDSEVSAEVEVSEADLMELVLNQFVPSEARPVVASAKDEEDDRPRLSPPPESSEEDFQSILDSL